MKKLLFAIVTIIAINACNSPQKMTSPNGDSTNSTMNNSDTSTSMQSDTTRRNPM